VHTRPSRRAQASSRRVLARVGQGVHGALFIPAPQHAPMSKPDPNVDSTCWVSVAAMVYWAHCSGCVSLCCRRDGSHWPKVDHFNAAITCPHGLLLPDPFARVLIPTAAYMRLEAISSGLQRSFLSASTPVCTTCIDAFESTVAMAKQLNESYAAEQVFIYLFIYLFLLRSAFFADRRAEQLSVALIPVLHGVAAVCLRACHIALVFTLTVMAPACVFTKLVSLAEFRIQFSIKLQLGCAVPQRCRLARRRLPTIHGVLHVGSSALALVTWGTASHSQCT